MKNVKEYIECGLILSGYGIFGLTAFVGLNALMANEAVMSIIRFVIG